MIRVLVADDSLTVRRFLASVVASQPDMVVVGEASDGEEAARLCLELRPDVLTLDIMMPVLDGVAATRRIMSQAPTPILIVSASFNRGELFRTYDALNEGAVEVLDKPEVAVDPREWANLFARTLRLVSRVRVVTRHQRAARAASSPPSAVRPASGRVIAIGASTGGPRALVDVLRSIRAPCRAPILVVLHIGAPFGTSFASWLSEQVPHRVETPPERGISLADARGVVVAPPHAHLRLRAGLLEAWEGPERHSCRPSIDVLFESLAQECGAGTVAALLTGMGCDGAAGLLRVRQAGGFTIAQDEATSVVFGMPREAIALGAAARVLPLGEIGPGLDAALTRAT